MKKRILIIILIIVILVLSIIVINKKANVVEEEILIEYFHYNHAWTFIYYGTIICESGNIYKFELADSDDYYNYNTTLSDLQENILKNITECVGTVSDSDLELIKKYRELVTDDDDNYEILYSSMQVSDSGATTIRLYKDNETITLWKYDGDCYKKNIDEYATKILDIVESYITSI